MKNVFHTLYGKISLIFLFLLFIGGSIQIFISVQSSLNYVCEAQQTFNRPLAKNLGEKFQPFLIDTINYAAIEDMIHEIMIINPRIDVYILDHEGNINIKFARSAAVKLDRVDTEPILKFISKTREVKLPIKGDDPLETDKKRVFSAAKIMLGSDPLKFGYVYIILGAELYDSAMSGVSDSYILSTTAIILCLTLLITGILGSILFFNLTKRLRNVTHSVHEFQKGNYYKRIVVKSDDEVGQLATAINDMADTIEENLAELKKNDAQRRELVANISHDLRSPLTSIQGYIETVLMKENNIDPRQRTQFLETILSNVKNLNNLVAELFELSKLDANQIKPVTEPFSIAELLQDIVLKFQPQAEHENINIITKIPHSLPLVIGDISMIDRVLSNLIDNAIRYTAKGGRISIELKNQNERVELTVSDSGEGIPQDDLPYVFDRFYRVEKSRTKNTGGSGLGLAIVKKIVEAHESIINVVSEVNKGTSFTFSLKTHEVKNIPA
jgi:signal transduction histidine kinase